MSPRFLRNAPCLAPVLSGEGHKKPRKTMKIQRNLTRFFTYRIVTHALSLPPVGWEKKKRLANQRSEFSACTRDAVLALSIDPHAVHNTHRSTAGIVPGAAVHVSAGLPLCVRRAHAARGIHRVCTWGRLTGIPGRFLGTKIRIAIELLLILYSSFESLFPDWWKVSIYTLFTSVYYFINVNRKKDINAKVLKWSNHGYFTLYVNFWLC